jgi:NitT/TauT family transport system substrate-binding protein
VQAGLERKDIVPLAVPKMPVRLELLVSGQLKAACLPEPLLTAAQQRGAKLLLSSDSVGVRAGVLIFAKSCIDSRAGDLAKMYRAYWKAASKINADNDAYRDFLVKKAAFPEATRDAYNFVKYHEPSLPSPEELSAVLSWMRELKLIKGNFPEGKLVDARAISGR